jgi:signal peptidase I
MSPLPPSDALTQSEAVRQPESVARTATDPTAGTSAQSPAAVPPTAKKPRGSLRALIDAGICLYVAVILFRTFEIEGYIISTGSMAPDLLGFHKRVVCPTCGYEFAHGIPVDETGTAADTNDNYSHEGPGEVRCPNCGEDRIDIRTVPPNHGDQLLVQKNVFEFRPPRRWEVVVLKSPSRPTPFVKRIVGLPNESVQIRDGDIYVNGEICRKDLARQRAVRIPVYDNDYPPDDFPEGEGCWLIENPISDWRSKEHGFDYSAHAGGSTTPEQAEAAPNKQTDWIAFRRWMRHGGRFHTAVKIAGSRPAVHLGQIAFPVVRFDRPTNTLEATGAVDPAEGTRLLSLNPDPATCTALEELFLKSHLAPVTDDYGYNRANLGFVPLTVRDLMLECEVKLRGGNGAVTFEIGDGRETFRLVLDQHQNEARLERPGQREPLRRSPLAEKILQSPVHIELSSFDRQIIAAINGELLFPAWECPTDRAEPSRVPLRIGANGLEVEVSWLRVYRDIYYTRGQGRNAVDRPIELGPDEFFVLGDNSPVSNDGRSWPQGAIKRSQLIGKPLVVHLPSRPGRVSLGGYTRYIRIPDFSRIRYIH